MTRSAAALQRRFLKLRRNRWFETLVILVIVLSALVIGAKTYRIDPLLQGEHEAFDRETGRGEAGEVHWLREHVEQMEQRLERMDALLEKIGRRGQEGTGGR